MKKPSRKTLVRQLDALVSQFIRNRDKKCVVCGSKKDLTNGHLFTRAAYSTRWDVSENGNCHCQCSSCNLRHEYDHYPFSRFYIEKFGLENYDELHFRHRQARKWKDFELMELRDKMRKGER